MTLEAELVVDGRVVPVEAEPLAHFLPGTSVLHVGPTSLARLADGSVSAADLAHTARRLRCASVAVPAAAGSPSAELVALIDETRSAGLRWIVTTDDTPVASTELLRHCDALLVETAGGVPSWLEELVDIDAMWVEIVARLAPDRNDGDASIHDLSSWVVGHLGPELPVHFMAVDDSPVPVASLRRARSIGLGDGLHYVYAAPLGERSTGITLCPGCGEHVIERRGSAITAYRLTSAGRCHACGTCVAGRFDGDPTGRAAAIALRPD